MMAAPSSPTRAACLATACLMPLPVAAQSWTCALDDGTSLRFAIDRSQFVGPQDPADPPRRKITQVTHGSTRYVAEPFMLDGMRGFHAASSPEGAIMFSLDDDGIARHANLTSGAQLTGICSKEN